MGREAKGLKCKKLGSIELPVGTEPAKVVRPYSVGQDWSCESLYLSVSAMKEGSYNRSCATVHMIPEEVVNKLNKAREDAYASITRAEDEFKAYLEANGMELKETW